MPISDHSWTIALSGRDINSRILGGSSLSYTADPVLQSSGQTTLTVRATLSENCTRFLYAVGRGAAAPSKSTIEASGQSFGAVAGVIDDAAYTELSSSTDYDIYEFARSAGGQETSVKGPVEGSTAAAGTIGTVAGNIDNANLETSYSNSGWNNNSIWSGGASWGSQTAVSVVRDDQFVVFNGNPISIEVSGREYENSPETTGSHALRINFGASGGEETTSNAHINIASSPAELWMRYWWRVPINMFVPTENTPRKWLNIWTDSYECTGGDSVTCVWGYRPNGSAGANLRFGVTHEQGGVCSTGNLLAESTEFNPFFANADAGRWMQMVHRLKVATGAGANNGIAQTWRRWEGESSWTQMQSRTNLGMFATNFSGGWSVIRLLGSVNTGFAEQTEFLFDDFALGTSDLR